MPFAPILYFFPSRADIPSALKDRFPRYTLTRNVPGPNGATGCLASRFEGVRLVFEPRTQRWDQFDDYFIGCDRDLKPATLLRPNFRTGTYVELADGNSYLIPIANPFAERCSLPAWHVLSPTRKWEKKIHDQYVDLSQRAADVADQVRAAMLSDQEFDIDDDRLRALLSDALAVNYDVYLEELSVMRVFAEHVYWPAVHALIDFDSMRDVLRSVIAEAANRTNPLSESTDTVAMSVGEPA